MKKKTYEEPRLAEVEVRTQPILAGSNPQGNTEQLKEEVPYQW